MSLSEEAAIKALESSQFVSPTAKMSRRSKRSSIATKSYKEIDSDDEHEKFKSIVDYESGSDFEEDLKKQTLGDEEDESDSEPEDENKLIIDEDLGGTNNEYENE